MGRSGSPASNLVYDLVSIEFHADHQTNNLRLTPRHASPTSEGW